MLADGAVAQLGERMTGSHEVEGSIPFGSTGNEKCGSVLTGTAASLSRVGI